jgi:hypothetical protein
MELIAGFLLGVLITILLSAMGVITYHNGDNNGN